jgi:hypothetical protein
MLCFLRKKFNFFEVLLLDVIYNVTAWITNQSVWYFSFFLASLVLSESTIVTPLSRINCTYISSTKILATCSQLSYEVILQFGKSPKIASILYVILVKKFIMESNPKKKKSLFKRYNLLDLVEWRAKKFEVQTKQVNFEILQLLSLLSNLGVVQNMISPTMS